MTNPAGPLKVKESQFSWPVITEKFFQKTVDNRIELCYNGVTKRKGSAHDDGRV